MTWVTDLKGREIEMEEEARAKAKEWCLRHGDWEEEVGEFEVRNFLARIAIAMNDYRIEEDGEGVALLDEIESILREGEGAVERWVDGNWEGFLEKPEREFEKKD